MDKIIVQDRIRKEMGDIAGLANNIKEIGLIEPIVINDNNILLSGERRLRAHKLLGLPQIDARMISTIDAEHELNIEISENEFREDFSKAERVDYMKRLLRIEQAKAKERQGERTDIVEIFPQSSVGKSRDITAAQFGISGKTMEHEIAIVDNKELLDPADFADWDEGRLSTNKAFQKIKAVLDEKNELLDDTKRKASLLEMQITDINQQLTLVTNERDSLRSINETLTTQNANLKEITSDVTNNWDPDYFSKPYREIDNLSCLNEYCRNAMYLFNSSLIKADDVRISLALKQDDDARRQYLEFLDFVSDWLKRQYARVNATDTIIDITTI